MSKRLGKQLSGEGAGIDVHLVRLTGDAEIQRLCRSVLSVEEIGRADRYRVDVARDEFVVSHASLRCLLAGYVGCLAGELEYGVGEHGKPELAGAWQGVEFNMSHSRGLAAIAVVRSGRVGVDIEGHRGFRCADSLAKTILSERELELYGSLAQVEQETFLIRSWTLKEAVLKGMGVGLAVNPGQVELGRVCSDSPEVVSVGGVNESAKSWRLILPTVSETHTLAIASDCLGGEQEGELRVFEHGVRGWDGVVDSSEFA